MQLARTARMREIALLLVLALALGGCSLYRSDNHAPPPDAASCESSSDRCACGCDAPTIAPIDVEGDLTLTQTVSGPDVGGCPSITPRNPLVLTVIDGTPKSLTAASPVAIESSEIDEGWDHATAKVDLFDDWAAQCIDTCDVWNPSQVHVGLTYTLDLDVDGNLVGSATGWFPAPDYECDFTVTVTGTYPPPPL